MLNKINLPILVTVMCVLLTGVTGLFLFNQGYLKNFLINKNNNSGIGTTEVIITRTDYSQTSRKILDWLETQRNETGWYILERGCDVTAKTCDTVWDNSDGNKDGLIATWSRFNFYNQTKDPKDLEIIKSDINKFYEKYPNGVNNALWICKITYDMWQSDLFDQETKDRLEKICFNTQFPTPEEVARYWSSYGGENDIKKILSGGQKTWESWNGYSLSLRGFSASFGYATDLLNLYQWKKDDAYFNEAKEYISAAKKQYESSDGVFSIDEINSPENVCLLGISLLDLYKIDRDEESFEYAKKIYEDKIFSYENRDKFITTICGLMVKYLYQETKEQTYLETLETNNRVLIRLSMDGNNVQIVNDEAFFKTDGKNNFSYAKNIAENALISESLRD